MISSQQWQDLLPRVLSGVVMIAVGAVELWAGGWPFRLFVVALCGVMIWETARMFDAPRPKADGVIGAVALLICTLLPGFMLFPILAATALVSAQRVGRDKALCFAFLIWVMVACFTLITLRDQAPLWWILWLVCIVVATDIAGYFAGRLLGGPKFWPAISPKKTWSGTAAGWLAAACVGWAFTGMTDRDVLLILASVAVSFASQMGDIGESAIKRRAGVKDSSSLIPGHGGVLDRFDGLMGGAVVMLVYWAYYSAGLAG